MSCWCVVPAYSVLLLKVRGGAPCSANKFFFLKSCHVAPFHPQRASASLVEGGGVKTPRCEVRRRVSVPVTEMYAKEIRRQVAQKRYAAQATRWRQRMRVVRLSLCYRVAMPALFVMSPPRGATASPTRYIRRMSAVPWQQAI